MNAALVEDRRLFERLSASFSLRFLDFATNKVGEGRVRDVSANGVGFVSSEYLAPNTALGIWLEAPGQDEPFYTRGAVAWSESIGSEQHRIGVRLERPQLMGIARILRLNQDFA